MNDPKEFWSEIGRLAGWRLGSYSSLDYAAFYTRHDQEVVIHAPVAIIINALAETLSEISDSFRTLIEAVEDLTSMKPGVERTKISKETRLLAKAYERSLNALQREHDYLFSSNDDVEDDG